MSSRLFLTTLACFCASVALAQHDVDLAPNDANEYKAGYSTKPRFGGPNSPEGQLEEDDRVKKPAFRFPAVYDSFESWRDWKRRQNEEHGFQFSGHYSTLYQGLSDSITGEDQASSGVFRAVARWTLLGKGTPDTGSLVVMVDNRHAYRDIAPAALASQAGYIGLTGTLYSDIDWAVVNLNWQQGFNDGSTGLLVGRYDPNDYMNVLGYSNPWTSFSNLAILFDASVAFPDASWGIGGGHWINDQFYLIGGVNDANGTVSDNLEFFDGGSEFFTWGHFGWSPTKAERFAKNAHLLAWNVDERTELGLETSEGLAFATNWTFDETWMTFFRAGWSDGTTPIYNKSLTAGLIRKFHYHSDWAGIGINWGDPPDDALREQTTIEAYWNFQFAQNLAFTPSVQLLLNPALNAQHDKVWVTGFRARLTF